MGLFDKKTAKEVANERIRVAYALTRELQDFLEKMQKAMARHLENEKKNKAQMEGFPIKWCSMMMEQAQNIYNEVAQCNGAIQVRNEEKNEK